MMNKHAIFDAHADTLLRVVEKDTDLTHRCAHTRIDIPRLLQGGVSIQGFAAWIDPEKYKAEAGMVRACQLIDALAEQIVKSSGRLQLADSGLHAEQIASTGSIAALLSLEGGNAINHQIENLYQLWGMGIRSMTLVWTHTHDWADSADGIAYHRGLSEFGKEVIRKMGELGMLPDLSHASEDVCAQVMDLYPGPVIFSHSCCRSLVDIPRNISDGLLKRLASRKGVVGISFYSGFLRNPEEPSRIITVKDVANHIEHAANIAGIDHVGLGSDFDGARDFPGGLEDASGYPALITELESRGFTDDDLAKILHGNFLRVFKSPIE
jgi:membrane dipeptidase